MIHSLRVPRLRFYSRPQFIVSDLGALSGLLFLLILYFADRQTCNSGYVWETPIVQLPINKVWFCTPEVERLHITINKDNRIFFSLSQQRDGQNLLSDVVQKVAAKNGVKLTMEQQKKLASMSYIGFDTKQLQNYFSLSPKQRRALSSSGIALNEEAYLQIGDYIKASKQVYSNRLGKNIYCALVIDKRVMGQQYLKLIHVLQQQGINRLNFVVEIQE